MTPTDEKPWPHMNRAERRGFLRELRKAAKRKAAGKPIPSDDSPSDAPRYTPPTTDKASPAQD